LKAPTEFQHRAEKIGRVLWDPARQRGLGPDVVRLKILSQNREATFSKSAVRPLLSPITKEQP